MKREILTRVPERLRAPVHYALRNVACISGLKLVVHDDSSQADFDAVYGSRAGGLGRGRKIPFDPESYEPGSEFKLRKVDGKLLWARAGVADSDVDPIGAIYRLLTFMDEAIVSEADRDRRGVFPTTALSESRREALAVPLVENLIAYIVSKYFDVPDAAEKPPIWPGQKRYALLVTHDTDAVNLGAPQEMVYNLAKWLLRRDAIRKQMLEAGWAARKSPNSDPFFGFASWRDAEASLEIRSSFFLFAQAGARRDVNDCRSTVFNRPVDWDLLRSMASDKWEFGLHAAINARDDLDAMIAAKSLVEEHLQAPIRGVRHHYWSIDWREPFRTYRVHENVGFRYDMSIAWRDAAGFRAGTCFPFQPFDPIRKRAIDLYVIPTAIMDGHVINRATVKSSPVAAALDVAHAVREQGGVLALDWHTETGCDKYCYRDYQSTLLTILERVLADDDAWITTPWDLVRFWRTRTRDLFTVGNGT